MIPDYVRNELSKTQIGCEAIQVIEQQSQQIAELSDLLLEAKSILCEVSPFIKEEIKKKATSWRAILVW